MPGADLDDVLLQHASTLWANHEWSAQPTAATLVWHTHFNLSSGVPSRLVPCCVAMIKVLCSSPLPEAFADKFFRSICLDAKHRDLQRTIPCKQL